jgi:hypothetical protein
MMAIRARMRIRTHANQVLRQRRWLRLKRIRCLLCPALDQEENDKQFAAVDTENNGEVDHSPSTTGFELQLPWPEAETTARYSPFWARKVAAGGKFWAVLGVFGQLQGVFVRRRRFFWLSANYRGLFCEEEAIFLGF